MTSGDLRRPGSVLVVTAAAEVHPFPDTQLLDRPTGLVVSDGGGGGGRRSAVSPSPPPPADPGQPRVTRGRRGHSGAGWLLFSSNQHNGVPSGCLLGTDSAPRWRLFSAHRPRPAPVDPGSLFIPGELTSRADRPFMKVTALQIVICGADVQSGTVSHGWVQLIAHCVPSALGHCRVRG